MKMRFFNLLKHHWCYLKYVLIFICFLQTTYAQQLAFPTAMGAGAYASGGRSGTVVHVTNLNDSGVGSLRWALTDGSLVTQDRTIVFDISGLIELNSNIVLSGPIAGGNASGGITIAGQTAPLGGITITGGKIRMFGVDNVIIRYLKFRETTPTDGCLSNTDGSNVIFDHLSASNTPDICFALTSNADISTNKTIQYCLMAQSKNALIIGDTTPQGDIDYGDISVIRNAYYNISHRIPFKGGAAIKVDAINNIAHNWKSRLIRMDDWDYTLNHIGNYYQGGTNTTNVLKHCSYNNRPEGNPLIYNFNNYMDPNETTSEYLTDESVVWTEYQNNFQPLPDNYFVDTQFNLKGNSAFTIFDSSELKTEVLPYVGSFEYINDSGNAAEYRDLYDAQHINGIDIDDATTRTTAIPLPIQTLSNTRPSNFYNPSKSEHIPEVWFDANVPNGATHNTIAPSGYTYLEEYINQVDDPPVIIDAESVTVTPETATLNVPETIHLSKSFTPSNTTDQSGTWSSSDSTIASVDINGLVTSVSEGEAIITFTSNDGGFTDQAVITVTNIVIPLESVTITPESATLDIGEEIQLNKELSPIDTTDLLGTWTSTDESVILVDEVGTVTAVSEGSADVIYTALDSGLTDSATITVIDVFYGTYQLYNADTDLIIQDISGNDNINLENEGDKINFRIIPEGGDSNPNVGSIEITWTGPSSGNRVENNPIYAGLPDGNNGLDFASYVVVEGTYNFTIEFYSEDDGSGELVAIDNFSLTFFFSNLPIANAGSDQNICEGETTTLSATGGIATNFLWSTGETTASIDVSPLATTTYTVTVSDNEGNSDEDSVTITVNPYPIADAGEDQTICEGETITLTASGGDSFLWSTGETSQSINVSPNANITYNVDVTSNSCTSADTVTVFVNDSPDITVNNDIIIVEGDSTTLTASGGDNYLWSTGETSASIDVSPSQTTTYTVSSVGVNGCSTTLNVTVIVEEPFAAFAGEDQRVCENSNYEVTLTANSGDSYLWNTGETTQSIIVSPLSTATYTVTVTQSIQEDTDDVTVFVDPSPNVIIANGDSVDIMNGDFVTLSASGANTYLWDNGATQPNIAVSPAVTTTYEVTGFIGDCDDEKQVTVNVIPEVEADAGEDVEICLGDTVTLTATGGDEYVWNTGQTTQSIEVSPTETTEYTVTVFNALDFDEDSVIVEVIVDCEEEEQPVVPDDGLEFSFDVFPNPASDYVDIKLSGSVQLTRLYLYDITGKLVYSKRVTNESLSTSSTTRVDVSSLNPGMYYIKMVDVNRDINKKLIVR